MMYEVAVYQKGKDGEERILLPPVTVVAPNERVAIIVATSDEDCFSSEMDTQGMEVLVRPFA